MTERTISTVLSARFVPKVGRYVTRLAFPDGKAEEVWMSVRQYDRLEDAFAKTPNGWSTRRRRVVGVWNDAGFYAWSRLEKDDSPHFPPCYDLTDLEDDL